jgi:hypothetical protein
VSGKELLSSGKVTRFVDTCWKRNRSNSRLDLRAQLEAIDVRVAAATQNIARSQSIFRCTARLITALKTDSVTDGNVHNQAETISLVYLFLWLSSAGAKRMFHIKPPQPE